MGSRRARLGHPRPGGPGRPQRRYERSPRLTLLSAVVATSRSIAATRSRKAKIDGLAALIGGLEVDEVRPAIGFLTGSPHQGRIGVGWATVFSLEVPAADASSLTIADLDACLDGLAATSGEGSVAARLSVLGDLLSRATPDEQEFIRRLLVGEMRQGALEGIMADGVARAAGVAPDLLRRAAMLRGSLADAAVLARTGGEPALASVGLTVLQPVSPMLASTAASVADALIGTCSVEWKLDGARVQAHRLDADVRLFTRNLNDVTARLAGVARIVAGLPVRSVVLDGEVLGLDEDERPDRFQDTMSRFGRHDGSGDTLGVVFFDCLHLDGTDLLDRPLTERLSALDGAVGSLRVPGIVTSEVPEAEAFLAASLAAGHEGVMVKDANSTYEAGRRGQAWRKVKPVRTFDLVVLAAEWGHGRRRGWLSNLHLGARDPRTPGRFVMVGKTFKGMTDELLQWQTARLQEIATTDDPPAHHVVPVQPVLVVEIALDGVQGSTRYPGGVALRFARLRRYRDDKNADEADTIDDLRALHGLGPLEPG